MSGSDDSSTSLHTRTSLHASTAVSLTKSPIFFVIFAVFCTIITIISFLFIIRRKRRNRRNLNTNNSRCNFYTNTGYNELYKELTERISLKEINPNTIDPNSNENLEENCLSTSTMSNISVVNNLSSIYDKWTFKRAAYK